jgi:pimeloyl-ACP methyl ester carboxylesterase
MGGSDMRIGFRAVQGVQIRFAESNSPTSPRLVLTGPWPESLLAFQRVWPRLSRTAHLLAVDLPGFGHSERRTELLGDRFARATRYVRSYPEQLQRLGQILSTIFTPVQIIAGRWDPLVPLANADYLHAACQTAASTCSTPAISPGKRHQITTRRSPPPGSTAATSPEAQDSSTATTRPRLTFSNTRSRTRKD